MSGTWALVPLDNLDRAKSRLAPLLGPAQRRRLVRAMVQDVLNSIARVKQISPILLVSNEPEAGNLFAGIEYEVFYSAAREGLNRELEQAADYAAAQGAQRVLIVHADLPFLTPGPLRTLLARSGADRLLAVPCKHGTGTNALLAEMPLAIRLQFGPDSLEAFRRQAEARGLGFEVIREPTLAMDIDDPEDYARLTRAEASALVPGKVTARLLGRQQRNERLLGGRDETSTNGTIEARNGSNKADLPKRKSFT